MICIYIQNSILFFFILLISSISLGQSPVSKKMEIGHSHQNITYDYFSERTSDLYSVQSLALNYQGVDFNPENPSVNNTDQSGFTIGSRFSKTDTYLQKGYLQGLNFGFVSQNKDNFFLKYMIGFDSKTTETQNQNPPSGDKQTNNLIPYFLSIAKWWDLHFFSLSFSENFWVVENYNSFSNSDFTKFKKIQILDSINFANKYVLRSQISNSFISDGNEKHLFDSGLYFKYETFPKWILLGVGYNWSSYKNYSSNYSSPHISKSLSLRSEWNFPLSFFNQSLSNYKINGSFQVNSNQEDSLPSQTGHSIDFGLISEINNQNQLNFNYRKSGADHSYSWYSENYNLKWLNRF